MPTQIFTAEHLNRLLLPNRPRLEQDLREHLVEFRPRLFEWYSLSYLHWIVQETLDIAAPFALEDATALRVFLQLRFDIAPGFWREPEIATTLGPTVAQRRVARAWLDSGTPLILHLFAYRDFTQISETRWQVDARGVQFVSACQRGQSAPLLGAAMPRMRALAGQIGSVLPPTAHIVEFACLPDGDVRLVEINPGLELPELRLMMAA